MDFWSIGESKIDANSFENRSRRRSKTRCKLGWSLDCSWIDLGSILEAKLEPSWHQNRSKMASKSMSKHVQKNDRKSGLRGHAGACKQTRQIWLLAPKKLSTVSTGTTGAAYFSKGSLESFSRRITSLFKGVFSVQLLCQRLLRLTSLGPIRLKTRIGIS